MGRAIRQYPKKGPHKTGIRIDHMFFKKGC
jgi:hypothetical protein